MTVESSRVIVATPVAQLFAEPHVASAQISQLVAGRTADVLESRDDWYRVRGPDAYEGWMHRGHLTMVMHDAVDDTAHAGRLSLGCVAQSPAGTLRAMPLGSHLTADERVTSGEAIDAGEQARRFPVQASAITRSAQQFFEGTAYHWGGVTPWGADCSGLVQMVYWLHGIQLRRDAWQQAQQGTPAANDPIASQAGDLLFFSDRTDRHITHVGIALGGCALVHLALGRGGYAVERMDDRSDPYVRTLLQRFIASRRVL